MLFGIYIYINKIESPKCILSPIGCTKFDNSFFCVLVILKTRFVQLREQLKKTETEAVKITKISFSDV